MDKFYSRDYSYNIVTKVLKIASSIALNCIDLICTFVQVATITKPNLASITSIGPLILEPFRQCYCTLPQRWNLSFFMILRDMTIVIAIK